MKTKELIIGIQSPKASLTEFGEKLKALERGERLKPEPETLCFESTDAAMDFFTSRRFALLKVIRRKQPQSIDELARLTHSTIKRVQGDVAWLAYLGFLKLDRKKRARERTIPRVDYDKLDVRIQIPV